ncbi:DNA-directed RNA polymerase II [Striga asiatica]|uniref:DNA-directed RNA polymerase II n=1 Tax=Striga asiatica TaxID=4170 RepID=A0A5A7RK13_STRAF|nr:DNA-directed RNA polymerase II [Striga asiatica]
MADESSKFADGRANCISMQVHAGSVEYRRYYMARRTLLEMLRDRGYMVANMEAELHRSLPDFRAEYGDKPEPKKLSLIAASATDSSRKIHAIFCEPIEIRKATMNFILGQILNKEQLDKVILILQSKMNSHALKVVEEHSIKNVKVETFQITELLVNITKHILMPKIEILNSEEKEKLLKKHNIQDKQLPMMLENDAMARYYGCEKGQVVKVTYSELSEDWQRMKAQDFHLVEELLEGRSSNSSLSEEVESAYDQCACLSHAYSFAFLYAYSFPPTLQLLLKTSRACIFFLIGFAIEPSDGSAYGAIHSYQQMVY